MEINAKDVLVINCAMDWMIVWPQIHMLKTNP
jgi:hypothetical protein